MLKCYAEKMPIVSVQGQVWHPRFSRTGTLSVDGETFWIQGVGGITLNAKIGDICTGWVADHLEPGVSSRNPVAEENDAYIGLSCIGNTAIIRTGDAKGDKGFVTGKHAICEHVILYFPDDTLQKLTTGDKIDVLACGQGMQLTDYPEIILRSMSPVLLEKMNIIEDEDKLKIGVAKIVPGMIMGSGIGANNSACGDYDITLFDSEITARYDLNGLRFGDIVAIMDADNRFGRTYRTGAVTIGVVIHSDCIRAGHGPGVTPIMSCKTSLLKPFIDNGANLYDLFVKHK